MPGSNSQGLQKSAAEALRLGLTVFQSRGLGYAVCAQYFVAREREIQRHRDTERQRQKQRQREREMVLTVERVYWAAILTLFYVIELLLCLCHHCEALWIGRLWATARTGSARRQLAGVLRCQGMPAALPCSGWLFPKQCVHTERFLR